MSMLASPVSTIAPTSEGPRPMTQRTTKAIVPSVATTPMSGSMILPAGVRRPQGFVMEVTCRCLP